MLTAARSPRAAAMLRLVVPASLVGAFSAIVLIVLSVAAERLQELVWHDLPRALDQSGDSAGWIIGALTLTGLAVGLVVWKVPGHAGPDPATEGLVAPPEKPAVLPSVALAMVLGLAGGVSLGPEHPIVLINVALAVWAGRRYVSAIEVRQWGGLAIAGTLGAMFATPVGAALMLSESRPSDDQEPWDRLFAPLVAAAVGALTMRGFDQPAFAVAVTSYPGPDWPDLISATVIALAAVTVGIVGIYAFPRFHAAFHAISHPVAMLVSGGFLLGVLGAIGGPITLFKGLDEMQLLATQNETAGRLAVIVAVKLVALLVAATCGFRGGRIFPAVFIGVAIGLLACELAAGVPPALAVGAAVMGMTLTVTRSGWLSLFMAVAIVGQFEVLPVLCVALLPAWLLVTDRPPMLVHPPSVATC